jgi:hypothetical protein
MMWMSSRKQLRDFKVQSVTEHADDKKERHALNLLACHLQVYKSLAEKIAHIARQLRIIERPMVSILSSIGVQVTGFDISYHPGSKFLILNR